LSERLGNDALQGDVDSDWVVLGAGYTGLAAARRLAENCPNQRIALIDAGSAGENASGRNSGFAIDLPHKIGTGLEQLEGSQRFVRLARGAIEYLQSAIDKHNIQCDWSKDGRYHAAASRRGTKEVLKRYANELESIGEPYEWVTGNDLVERIGTNHYSAAVYTPGGALMNPAALTRGLADSLPSSVTLYENSPVIEVESKNGIVLRTANGTLRAPKMILAANGYAEQFGYYKNSFIHCVGWASITRALNDEEQAIFGVQKPFGITPANSYVGKSFRYTNDRRIFIRYGVGYCPSQAVNPTASARMAVQHKKLFDQRFPMLPRVEIEHTWSGLVCLSKNRAPGFGQLEHNVWSAVCHNAVGVTKGTIGGVLAADLACGRENSLIYDIASLGEPNPLPPRPILDVGLNARLMWEIWSNRNEA